MFKHELDIPALDCLNERPRPEDQESLHFSGRIQVQPVSGISLPILVPNAHNDAFDLGSGSVLTEKRERRTTPGMEAGVADHCWTIEDLIAMMERLQENENSN